MSDESDLRAHRDRQAVLSLYAERDRYKDALEEIVAHLGSGPCRQIKCEGCEYEFEEASRIAHEALGKSYTRMVTSTPPAGGDSE